MRAAVYDSDFNSSCLILNVRVSTACAYVAVVVSAFNRPLPEAVPT